MRSVWYEVPSTKDVLRVYSFFDGFQYLYSRPRDSLLHPLLTDLANCVWWGEVIDTVHYIRLFQTFNYSYCNSVLLANGKTVKLQ